MTDTIQLMYKDAAASPARKADALLSNMRGYPTLTAEGRVTTGHTAPYLEDYTRDYKRTVRGWDANGPKSIMEFPKEHGLMSYQHHVEDNEELVVLFKHAACTAHNYYKGRQQEDHIQPQVYFFVTVNKNTGNRGFSFAPSRWGIGGGIFPHSKDGTSGQERINCCCGAYENDLHRLVKEDNLDMFLAMMSAYLVNGTKRNYDFSRSYKDYVEGATVDNYYEVMINSPKMAELIAIVYMDMDNPFNLKITHQQVAFTFDSTEIEVDFDTLTTNRRYNQ